MKRLASFAAALAVTAVTAMGIGTAQAVAAGSDQLTRATASSAAVAAVDGYPNLRGRYVTRGGCLEAGQEGVARGHWTGFQCANGTFFWILWTD
ncbi:hypothetical protein [Streptomyces sp. NPDC050804]|uniref:hypothetical protein n=1 Tax=unclassified Streptomyces TaxID=2593676 RepID=UPI00341DC669|nr:hypothetical protein OG214_17330 [Streptomyces sp. NBC_00872]